MATIDVKDAGGTTVAIEKPLTPGRAAAAASRPVVLSTEDLAALASQTTLAALLAKVIAAPSTEAKQDATNVLLNAIGLSVDGVEAALGALATQTTLAAVLSALGSPMQSSGGSVTAGGRTPRITATYSNPASATQYTIGDLIGNSLTAGLVTPIDFGALTRDSGRLSGARCVVTAASGTIVLPKFDLLLFRSNTDIPVAAGGYVADNGVLNITAAAMKDLIGILSFSDTGWRNQLGGATAAGDHVYQAVSFATRPYAPFNLADLGTKKILGLMQDQGAWNPGNVANTFDFVLDMDQD